nr:TIGR01906 family membrane protein [uncultured Peptoniphilus sp.]
MNRVLSIVVVLSCFFLLFSFSTEAMSQDQAYYVAQMEKNGIPDVTGKSMDSLSEISSALRAYLKRGEGDILAPYFSASEIDHMVDVYALFKLMRTLTVFILGLAALSLYILSLRTGWRRTLKMTGESAIGVLVALLLFSIIVALNFHAAWFKFHEIFFSNDLWLMDPEKDLMIQMLPEPFFFGMVKRIGLTVLAGMIGLSGLYFIKGDSNEVK